MTYKHKGKRTFFDAIEGNRIHFKFQHCLFFRRSSFKEKVSFVCKVTHNWVLTCTKNVYSYQYLSNLTSWGLKNKHTKRKVCQEPEYNKRHANFGGKEQKVWLWHIVQQQIYQSLCKITQGSCLLSLSPCHLAPNLGWKLRRKGNFDFFLTTYSCTAFNILAFFLIYVSESNFYMEWPFI